MGDPGIPMMAGLLGVPVGVLLFVIVLALLGGRSAAPSPTVESEPPSEPFELVAAPSREPAGPELARRFEPWIEPAQDPASPRHVYGYRPVDALYPGQPYGSGSPDAHGTMSEDRYGSSVSDPYESPAPGARRALPPAPNGPYDHARENEPASDPEWDFPYGTYGSR